jgi:phage recombination protein Bet
MNDENALQRADPAPSAPSVDLETLRAAVSRGGVTLDNSQLKLAVAYSQRRGLDLISGQLIPTVMDGRLTFITTIDGLRVIAERSGEYRGQGAPIYGPDCGCGQNPKPHPEWAEVPVYRKGWEVPMVRRAYWHEYKPTNRPYTWDKMPHVMIAKVSEAAALRAAFPNDMSGLYTGDEMEQAAPDQGDDRSAQALEGMAAAARVASQVLPPTSSSGMPDIPDDAPQPEWATFVGPIMEAPDGVRAVKTPDWAPKELGSHTEKLELKLKVGRSKHTAMVLGDLAGIAANQGGLAEGVRVAVDGTLYEYEWQEGKPKAKQIRNVTRLAVLGDDGAWHYLAERPDEVEGVAREVDQPPDPTPDPVAQGMAEDFERAASEPPAADLTTEAAAAFDDMLDADVDPARGGNPQVGASWEELPILTGANEQPAELEGYFARGEMTTTAQGKEMYDGWLTSADMKHRVHVVMSKAWAEAAGVQRLGPGEQVRVQGVWRHPGGQPVVLASMMRPT